MTNPVDTIESEQGAIVSEKGSTPRCSTCKGNGQDYAEEWDVVHKMMVTIHLDNGCKPCRGTGRVVLLAPRPAPAEQARLEGV